MAPGPQLAKYNLIQQDFPRISRCLLGAEVGQINIWLRIILNYTLLRSSLVDHD